MTFYQELQLNQAGSKNLLKKSETVKEKSYHILVYLVKIAVTMVFCFLFVTIFSILFGNENSIVGVVVLLCLMVFRNADLGIHTGQSTMLLALFFVLCNYDCMSAFSKPAFTGTWNAVKHCCNGSADSVWMS